MPKKKNILVRPPSGPENCEVCVEEFLKKDLKGYTLVEGFPGIGLVGTIGAKYLIEKLDFKKFGYIRSNIFIPVIRIREGKPVYPSRIFVNEKEKLAVILSEQIIPTRFTDDFARAIVSWLKEKEIKKVISIGGIQTDEKGEQKMVYGIAANDATKEYLKKFKVDLVSDGVTSGISALMLLELKETNIKAFSIMSNINVSTDYRAAAELIKTLNHILGLKIDIKPLLKEAKEAEAELLRYMQRLKSVQGRGEVTEKPSELPPTT